MNIKVKALLIASLAMPALALTACSESAANNDSGSSDPTITAISAELGAQFSGGTAGTAATGDPITIGVINQEGGSISDPEVSVAIQAAFDYLNAEQGGVGGRPLKMKLCKIASSEEEAQQCAQEMLNDDDVQLIIQGGLNIGTQAVHQTINGQKPVFVSLANPGSDTTASNTYVLNPSSVAAIGGMTTFAKSQGYSTISIISDSNSGNLQIVSYVKQTMEAAGLTVATSSFPEGSTDMTSALTAALSTNPDALSPVVVSTSGCVAIAKALQQLSTDAAILSSSLCATDTLRDAMGDLPSWSYESTALSLYAPDDSGQVDFYRAVMAAYAGADAELSIGAPAAFGAAFAVAKVLNGLSNEITVDSVTQAATAFTGPVLLGTPKLAFGSIEGMSALGGLSDRFYTYQGNDTWKTSDWQNLPE